MKRRLFDLLAAFSLLLCIGILVLWVRSYWHTDKVTLAGRYLIASHPSAVEFARAAAGYWSGSNGFQSNAAEATSQFARFFIPGMMSRPPRFSARWIGFSYGSMFLPSSQGQFIYLDVPLYFPLLLFLLGPFAWLRHRRAEPIVGRCPICGYDLRATPDRCPECGTVSKPA